MQSTRAVFAIASGEVTPVTGYLPTVVEKTIEGAEAATEETTRIRDDKAGEPSCDNRFLLVSVRSCAAQERTQR